MNLTFPDAKIRFVDLRSNEEGGDLYAKINITAGVTKAIRKAMDWGSFDENGKPLENWPGNGETGGGLSGELNVKSAIFTPKEKGIRKEEIDLAANIINAFKWKPEKGDGGGTGTTIDFVARISDFDSIMKLVKYLARVGPGFASLKVSYDKQEKLPGMDGGGDDDDDDAQGSFDDGEEIEGEEDE